jgi:competence protein ComEC
MATGLEGYHKYPALAFAVLVGFGIWLGDSLPRSPCITVSLAVSAFSLAGLLLRGSRTPACHHSVLTILLCVGLGALKLCADDPPDALLPPPARSRIVTVTGIIADAPSRTAGRTRFAFKSAALITDTSAQPCVEAGIITCIDRAIDSGGLRFDYGMMLALRGTVELPPEAGNPGAFSPRQYYRANGFTFLMTVRGAGNVQILDAHSGGRFMRGVVMPLRTYILTEIDADVGGVEGEFLKGLLIGERSGLSPEIRRAFLDSGVAHILAVSGSNVAVVAGAIMMVLSLLRLPKPIGHVLTGMGLLLFMLVTGTQPPVVRATIMALALLCSNALARKVHPLNGVGVAAVLMFLGDARQLFDAGFQLSFGAVVSILVLYPVLQSLYPHRGRESPVRRVARQIYNLAAVSIAANAGTLPLTAIVFGRISLVGFAANLVVVPVSGLSVVLGMISAAAAPLSSWTAGAFAAVNRILLALTILVAERAAAVPWAAFDAVAFRPVHALPLYAALGMLLSAGRPARLRRCFIAFLVSADVALLWPSPAVAELHRGTFRLTMVDVGQGDAILLQAPGGRNLLIDTGPPSHDGSPWGTSIVPFLRQAGVSALEDLIITHAHDDHAGGMMHVARTCAVRQLVVTPDVGAQARRALGSDSASVRTAAIGHMLGDSVYRCYVLSPPPLPAEANGNANRRSIVLKVLYGGIAMLLMGDAETEEEAALLDRYGAFLESDVLKVGHHGSRAGSSSRFLATVRPTYALISVGRFNRFGHPARATLQRLSAAGAEILRTDEQGAVMLETDGATIHRIDWR